jgi:hypothetical protein
VCVCVCVCVCGIIHVIVIKHVGYEKQQRKR